MNIQLLDALFKTITANKSSSVTLTYNDPRILYSTVEKEDRKWKPEEWSSPFDRSTAIDSNEVWILSIILKEDLVDAVTIRSDTLYRLLISTVARLFGKKALELPTEEEFTNIEKFLKTLLECPKENTSLGIHYNEHYVNGLENIENTMECLDIEESDFVDSEELTKALTEDNLCKLYWYSATPGGHYEMYASTLEAIVKDLKEDLANDKFNSL